MISLRHECGYEEVVVAWSLRHYELRHMGYEEVEAEFDRQNLK